MIQMLTSYFSQIINRHRTKILVVLSCLTYFSLLSLIWISNDSICTNSTTVNSIDIIRHGKKDTVYHCDSKQKANFDVKIEKIVNKLNQRLPIIENYLVANSPQDNQRSKFSIVINYDRLLQFELSDTQLKIGAVLLEEPGNLERGLIKYWIRSKINDQLLTHGLFEESVVDLIYFSFSGRLDIVDPINAKSSRIGYHRWPQVLKSFDEYCESSWKMLEHSENCSRISSQKDSETVHDYIEMSLRPLTSQALIQAYLELNLIERQKFISHLPTNLQKFTLSSNKALETILEETNPLKKGLRSIRSFANVFTEPKFLQELEYKKFAASISELLEQSGVTDSFAEAYVDYLVEIPETLRTDGVFFKSLKKAAERNTDIQFAVTDRKNIWILPFGDRLPVKSFDQIHSRQVIFFACPALKEFDVKNYFHSSEKLLLIKGCEQNSEFNFSTITKNNLNDFLHSNSEFSFLQFHLPSLESKQKDLEHIKNFFELVKNRKFDGQEFKILGWTQIQWSEETNSYKPKAAVDAIEYFRLNDSEL
jgi:hypothetical protein